MVVEVKGGDAMAVKGKPSSDGMRTTIYITDKYVEAYDWVQRTKATTGNSVSNIIFDIVAEYVLNVEKNRSSIVLPLKAFKDGKMSFRKIEFQGRKLISVEKIDLPRKQDSVPGYTQKIASSDFIECSISVYQTADSKLLTYIKTQVNRYESCNSEYGYSSDDDGRILFEISECKIYPSLEELVQEYPEIPQGKLDELILELCPSVGIDEYVSGQE